MNRRNEICEIIYFKDLSHKISIAEYNKLSSSFLNKNEVGLINGILDKIAKNKSNEWIRSYKKNFLPVIF